jgi:hypothetical protein
MAEPSQAFDPLSTAPAGGAPTVPSPSPSGHPAAVRYGAAAASSASQVQMEGSAMSGKPASRLLVRR